MFLQRQIRTTQSQAVWPVLVLVSIGIIAPTACVLWFMNQAVRSEQFAVRQRLEDVYRSRLAETQKSLETYWQNKSNTLHAEPADAQASETFARLVRADAADSVIVHDSNGHVLYPSEVNTPGNVEEDSKDGWEQAHELEFILKRPAEAAAAYAAIATQTKDADVAARALLAQARCLAQSGQSAAALGILSGPLSEQKYSQAKDAQGRLIQCHAQLLILQLPGSVIKPEFRKAADALIRRVQDYRDPEMLSAQRRFLMEELKSLVSDCPAFATLPAEELAADYLSTLAETPNRQTAREPLRMTLSPRGDLWRLSSSDGTMVALFRKSTADSVMQGLIEHAVAIPDVSVALRPFGDPERTTATFITVPAGAILPQYQLALSLNGPDPLAAAARRRVLLYIWTGGSGIFVIVLFGLVLARLMTRQIALARLKNDLVATVTHELKTPLASMRVLIDTLAEGRTGTGQTQEYYRLISKENERLSRLIENFLTFSRMERHKQTFTLTRLDVSEIVTAAVAAMGDRLQPPQGRLEVRLAPDLPMITGDRDALVTVVLNLLDNACKYSQHDPKVEIGAYAENGCVCLEVRDNGIGMSKRTVKKVFDRFYQADLSLSRKAGGCGLGLSIVKFIVTAHGGRVAVSSEPGCGSTFTVALPAEQSHTVDASTMEPAAHA